VPVAATLLVWPFVLDPAYTFTRRVLRGENVFAGHRTHLYQRLMLAGWGHAAVALLYGALALAGLLLALAWLAGRAGAGAAVTLGTPALFAMLVFSVQARERRRAPSLSPPEV
jgi:hypothetical protein